MICKNLEDGLPPPCIRFSTIPSLAYDTWMGITCWKSNWKRTASSQRNQAFTSLPLHEFLSCYTPAWKQTGSWVKRWIKKNQRCFTLWEPPKKLLILLRVLWDARSRWTMYQQSRSCNSSDTASSNPWAGGTISAIHLSHHGPVDDGIMNCVPKFQSREEVSCGCSYTFSKCLTARGL